MRLLLFFIICFMTLASCNRQANSSLEATNPTYGLQQQELLSQMGALQNPIPPISYQGQYVSLSGIPTQIQSTLYEVPCLKVHNANPDEPEELKCNQLSGYWYSGYAQFGLLKGYTTIPITMPVLYHSICPWQQNNFHIAHISTYETIGTGTIILVEDFTKPTDTLHNSDIDRLRGRDCP